MTVQRSIVRFLAARGVDTVFTLMAEDIFGITAGIQSEFDDEISVVETRHEQWAVSAADGYARATDDVGVAIIGRGPAIAQTGTGLGTAVKNGSKLLVITSQTPHGATEDVKGFPQETYLEAIVGDVRSVRAPGTLVETFADIFHDLQRGSGPVVVQIPWDVMEEEVELPSNWEQTIRDAGATLPGHSRTEPSADLIEQAVDLVLDADVSVPPVLLAGQGATSPDTKAALEALAQRISAVPLTTLQGNGLFSDHPYSPGFAGTFGTNLANEYLAQSGLVVAVGCSLNDHTTDRGRLIGEESTVVHVDDDPGAIGRHRSVDLGIVGDATAVVERLDDALESEDVDMGGTFWTDRLKRRVTALPDWTDQEVPAVPDRVDPRELVLELESLLPDDRFVVTDGGHFINWVLDGISVQHPDAYEWTIDFGAVGVGLPISIGAASSGIDRPVVAFCGDCGFMMSSQELDTAVRQDLPLVVIVMNDDALGSEYQQLQNKNMYREAAIVETPDIAALAEAYGATGYSVTSLDDLDAAASDLASPPRGPVVLDCKINRDVRHRFYDTDHMM